MLGLSAQFCVRTTVPGFGTWVDQPSPTPLLPSWVNSCSVQFSIVGSRFNSKGRRRPKLILISCQSSRDSSGSRSRDGGGSDHDYFEASLLVSETIQHYRLWKQGFQGDMNFNKRESRVNTITSPGLEFFRRFQNPTVFLKISCNEDFLLPIVVGELAIEKLINGLQKIETGDPPDLYEFIQNLIEKFGYDVVMVRITERSVNTYFARLYLIKGGENDMFSVDARPSDALNIAHRCKIPILVSKRIVFEDAIRFSFGTGRVHDRKSCYDVFLDSVADGPDFLTEELVIMKNMELAIQAERYDEAAMWRDKLSELRKSKQEP